MRVAEALVQAFVAEGATDVFGLMGAGNTDFVALMGAQEGGRVFDARHEAAAVAMADGYARATGRVGVASITHGPGLTQIGTSLMTASRHGTPLIIHTGDTSTAHKTMGGRAAIQDMDQQAFALSCGALFQPLRSPETVADDVQRAFTLARTQRLPVVLNAPLDVQESPLGGTFDYRPSTTNVVTIDPLPPSPVALERAIAVIAAAERPVILAGRGAVAADARSVLEELGDRIGALLSTTLLAKGWFDGSPYDVGIAGGFSLAPAETAFAQADLVLVVGASLSPFTTQEGNLYPNAQVLRIDRSTDWKKGTQPVDHFVQSDAREGVAAILDGLAARGHRHPGFREDDQLKLAIPRAREHDLEVSDWGTQEGTVDTRRLMMHLDRLLPHECIVVIGAGHFFSTAASFLQGHRSRRFVFSYDFGSIGQGFPTALGVALSNPGVPTIAFEGDASMLMHIQELDTAARYGVDLLTFVLNDGALGAEFHTLEMRGYDPELAVIPTPSFSSVGTAFGVASSDIHSYEDIAPSVEAFHNNRGPQLVDVHLDRRMVSRFYRRAFLDFPVGA
jgi:acetolactate synthase-1/2/3 large subunit